MKSLRTLFVLCTIIGLLCFLSNRGTAAQTEKRTLPIVVNVQWLKDHLNDENLVVLQVAQTRREYTKGHIPGARFLWHGWMAMSNPDLSYEVLPVEELDAKVEELGISNDSKIILCGVGGNVSPVARMFITFEYLGMGNQTAILDGGLEAWKADGNPLSTEIPKVERSSFTPDIQSDIFVNADWVNKYLGDSTMTIVDARAPQFYLSTTGGAQRAGHIPGAKNIYYSTLVDSTNKFLDEPTLKEMFLNAGVKANTEVTSYCHVGQTGSLVYVVARYLGYKAHLFDGSFEDWSGRDDLPVEISPKADSTK
ncbi:MAG: sulfurtransferase [Ignavibacteriae bacterium]|nr:sulfurtransferase [Ignavibacteriota bacterium]